MAAAGEVDIQGKPLSQWLTQLRGENRGLQIRAARIVWLNMIKRTGCVVMFK